MHASRHLGQDESGLDAIDVDYGRLDFEISQVDVVLQSPWWRLNKDKHTDETSEEEGATPVVPTLAVLTPAAKRMVGAAPAPVAANAVAPAAVPAAPVSTAKRFMGALVPARRQG